MQSINAYGFIIEADRVTFRALPVNLNPKPISMTTVTDGGLPKPPLYHITAGTILAFLNTRLNRLDERTCPGVSGPLKGLTGHFKHRYLQFYHYLLTV